VEEPTPPDEASKGSERNPLEVYSVEHPGLPVYSMTIGPPNLMLSTNTSTFVSVNIIMDTGAESNYLTKGKANTAGAQIFPITAREIVGAGPTVTMVFALFTLKIGGLFTKCYAYVLGDNAQFRYDLLLGRAWLKRHSVIPRWDDDAYELTHPEERTQFFIKPMSPAEWQGIPKLLAKLSWRLWPKHLGPRCIEAFLHATQTTTINKTDEKFGNRVKKIVKESSLEAFKEKVGT
jgi:hypothetical protein